MCDGDNIDQFIGLVKHNPKSLIHPPAEQSEADGSGGLVNLVTAPDLSRVVFET